MKKLVTAFAACMIAGLVSAQVTSQNIVGYTSTSTPTGKFISEAIQYVTVGSTGDITLDNLQGASAFKEGDQIKLAYYSGAVLVYTTYTYHEQAYLDDNLLSTTPGWYDTNDNRVNDTTVKVGSAFWFYSKTSDNTVTTSGEVLGTASNTSATLAANKYTMICNPYPVAFTPNTYTWTGIGEGAQLKVPFYSGAVLVYATYTYHEQAYLDDNLLSTAPGWYDTNDNRIDGVANVGQGFWVYPKLAATVTITKPY